MPELLHRLPHVAIVIARTHVTHTQLLRGILRYTQCRTPWTLDVRMGREGEPEGFSGEKWRYDGVIAARLQPGLEAMARRYRTPTVFMSDLHDIGAELQAAGRIRCDNASVSRMAAGHLVGKGFRRLAFVGAGGAVRWSDERCAEFAKAAAEWGAECRVCPERGGEGGDNANDTGLREWLLSLPKPTGVFAAFDVRARAVIDACAQAGIVVPDELAVLGVDDDAVLCETSFPTLSSIAMTTEDAGFRAAEVLAAAMAGGGRRDRKEQQIVYGAKAVVERASTARDQTRDELARRCRALVEANIASRFGVADLAKSLCVSRRTLETRFRAAVGRTVGEEIAAQRIQRARTLLSQTHMSQAQIAEACGFVDASHMNAAFHRGLGVAPGRFRSLR